MLLVACGDSGSDAADSTATTGSATTEAGTPGESGDSPEQGGTGNNGSGQQNGAGEGIRKTFTVEEVSTPLEVSGGGSEQFRVQGGDNSIQEYGEEQDESELEAAAEAVHGFYVDRAAGNWAGACSRMSAMLRDQLEQLAEKSEVKGCPPFLEAFTSPLSAETWREVTTVNAESLRRDGSQGFLIYVGEPDETVYAMPLKDEGGEWKVTALSATTLN